MTEIAIVGLGPWGLAFLERLVSMASADPTSEPVTVHAIDPGAPGCGAFETELPDYLILNTPCGWHAVAPELSPPHPGDRRRSMLEWLIERDYRWEGDACLPGGSGRTVSPDDFLPRRVMGEYLEWSFNTLLADLPAQVHVVQHRSAAVDVAPLPTGRERVTLATGEDLEVDHVVIATGHTPNAERGSVTDRAIPPYPVSLYDDAVLPGETAAMRGMGLVAMDVMIALTAGRGGVFEQSKRVENRLQYLPSGREPIIYMFSRTGYAYCARDSRGRPTGAPYQPAICTPEAVEALKREHPAGELNARRDFLPLLFAEMQMRYYTRAATYKGDEAAGALVYDALAQAWRAGSFAAEIHNFAASYGVFDAEQHFFVGTGAQYVNAKDYEQQVYDITQADLDEAINHGAESPLKAAYGIPRQLRDVVRSVVDGDNLTAESKRDFQRNIRPRIARLIAGPPILRVQQLLALIDADIVRLATGPSPSVELSEGGGVILRSTQLQDSTTIHADRFVQGTLDDPTVSRSASALLANLFKRGRIRPLSWADADAGGVDLTSEFNPVSRDGEPERTLWVLGSLTEGARYYTGYIPSPRDMRASRDAAACVAAMTQARS
jgi:uncharacterized NAD(P)/FAD-binding protein YdhS